MGNNIFRDTTTLAKICPPPPYINVRETFPGDFTPFTPQESHLRNREKRRCQDQSDIQECPDPQDTQEKHKSPPRQTPPHQKRKNKKKFKVVHSKEYKIRRPKKRPVVKKCSLCSESFDSQLELNLHTESVHKYKFLCSSRQCGKTFGSLESLKKHGLRHGEMKYLCQVCGQNFPFASDLASHASIHSAEKNSSALILSVVKCTKLRLNTIAIIITGTNKSQQSHRKLSVRCVTKCSPKSNI